MERTSRCSNVQELIKKKKELYALWMKQQTRKDYEMQDTLVVIA